MREVSIEVRDLGKLYRIGERRQKPETLVMRAVSLLAAPFQNMSELNKLRRFKDTAEDSVLEALLGVTFDVFQGEVLGVIGKNGAGKSTLLKVLSRITYPSQGRIKLHGRVASLLEVGTGFHPELTGRENIYLNGTLLGMTKPEVDEKFGEIVDFSGVEQFLETPIKRYSSGMRVRLAFAVAAHLEPEILLIDEVLAVGDFEFQQKCLGKMGEVAESGRTILFVSHDLGAIETLCHRVIVLDKGRIVFEGPPEEAVTKYLANVEGGVSQKQREDPKVTLIINDVKVEGESYVTPQSGRCLSIHFDVEFKTRVQYPNFLVVFKDGRGRRLFECNSRVAFLGNPKTKDRSSVTLTIPRFPLNEGSYLVDIVLRDSLKIISSFDDVLKLSVGTGPFFQSGRVPDPRKYHFLVDHQWQFDP